MAILLSALYTVDVARASSSPVDSIVHDKPCPVSIRSFEPEQSFRALVIYPFQLKERFIAASLFLSIRS